MARAPPEFLRIQDLQYFWNARARWTALWSLGRVSIKRLVDRLVPHWTARCCEDVADLIEVLTDYP
jgi:hypothetical protein